MTSWDETKRRRNREKHGVDLAEAARFDFVTALILEDDSERYGERRDVALGWIDDVLYVYVYSLRGEEDHAISLRKADARERRHYAEEA